MLSIHNLTKRFGAPPNELLAVDCVSFDVAPGEFFTMLGPSGCGKTTTLRMIAGLEAVSEGSITFDNHDYTRVPTQQRNIGMVFQSYALFPHLSVFENVAYGLRMRGFAGAEIERRAAEVLRALQLDGFRGRLPATLSGGQQQRVSIARALIYRPSMLLLDEPLANLDAKLRLQMREEIRRIQREFGILSLYVTHDQEEAMAISDRLALFNAGRLIQVGEPREMYRHPASLFAAEFVGHANFLPANIQSRDRLGAKVTLRNGSALTIDRIVTLAPDESARIPQDADGLVMARPEAIAIATSGKGLAGSIRRIQPLGGLVRYVASTAAADADVTIDISLGDHEFPEGAQVVLEPRGSACTFFVRA